MALARTLDMTREEELALVEQAILDGKLTRLPYRVVLPVPTIGSRRFNFRRKPGKGRLPSRRFTEGV